MAMAKAGCRKDPSRAFRHATNPGRTSAPGFVSSISSLCRLGEGQLFSMFLASTPPLK
jgi:hypothetical protein